MGIGRPAPKKTNKIKKRCVAGIEPASKRLAIRFSLKGYLEPKWLRWKYYQPVNMARSQLIWKKPTKKKVRCRNRTGVKKASESLQPERVPWAKMATVKVVPAGKHDSVPIETKNNQQKTNSCEILKRTTNKFRQLIAYMIIFWATSKSGSQRCTKMKNKSKERRQNLSRS